MEKLSEKRVTRRTVTVASTTTPSSARKPTKLSQELMQLRAEAKARSVAAVPWPDYRTVFQGSRQFRIEIIRAGVQATDFKLFIGGLGIAQDKVCRMLAIAPATVNRKALQHQPLSNMESEKVLGMIKLVGQVETMLDQSGDPALMKDFNASQWLARWIEEPNPALGGQSPSAYMDTIEGQELVASLLSMMQTGAYA